MQPELWQILLLAVLQGTTEFLPVSSSGHLVIAAAWLQPTGSTEAWDIAELNIVLHAGTLGSILVFYWQRLLRLVGADWRVLPLLAIGTLPAVAVGLPLKLFFGELLESPLLAGCLLIGTGGVLIWGAAASTTDEAPSDGSDAIAAAGAYTELNWAEALLIGLAQAAAILPGFSRSGLTISAGLRLGMSRESAATFSFLLAVPVIAGACVLELKDLFEPGAVGTPLTHLAAGAAVAFVVGWISLWGLVRLLERGQLAWFAAWCIPAGIAVIVWQLGFLNGSQP